MMQLLDLLEQIQYNDLRSKFQHALNPLHIYTKLRKVGVKKSRALQLSKSIERLIGPVLYPQKAQMRT